jgi:hypothetical protein
LYLLPFEAPNSEMAGTRNLADILPRLLVGLCEPNEEDALNWGRKTNIISITKR